MLTLKTKYAARLFRKRLNSFLKSRSNFIMKRQFNVFGLPHNCFRQEQI